MTPPTESVHIESADQPTRVPLAIEDWAMVIIMGFLACMTFANVLMRYFTDAFAWTEEFSVFLMVLLALMAASAAVARDRRTRTASFARIAARKQ